MVRTQIQITEDQAKALRQLSAATGRSIADLIREAVDANLRNRAALTREEQVERAIRFAGRFSSGAHDGSAAHDRLLAEAFKS